MDGGGIKPGPGPSPVGPKSSEGMGERAKDMPKDTTPASDGTGQSQPTQSGMPAMAEKVKNKASEASEMAKDVKDVAQAGPTGLESTGKEIKEGAEKARAEGKSAAKGAAGAAGREATGQAVATGLDVVTAGATTEMHGKIAKGVSKGLKKENLKKILFAAALFLSIPLILIGILFAVIVYIAQNPIDAVVKVLTDPKIREFSTQVASGVGDVVTSDATFLKYGYVDKKSGTAIAAPTSNTPKPGSIEEKMLKINIKNAEYQTNSKPSCPYTYTTKELVGPNGKTTSVIDQVKDERGEVVTDKNFLVYYCVIQSMPIYNMMVRTQKARDVNKFSGTILSYADSDSSPNLLGKSYDEIKKYVYKKTYDRITSKASEDPKTRIASVNKYIAEIREALANNKDPDAINYKFEGDPNSTKNIQKTMCAFSQGYLSADNIRKGIYTRLGSGQRSGMKWNTLASTRSLGKLGNTEMNATFKELDGWAGSRAYSQNVYGTQAGEAIDPERLGNTTYGAGYVESTAYLYDLKKRCESLDDNSFVTTISRFLGWGESEDDSRKKIMADYDGLKEIIVAESNGKFNSINDFGVEQLMIGVIRMGGGSAVSGLEPGVQNFNNQSQGFRSLSNQYLMRMGGRFLNDKEYSEINALAENTKRELIRKNGIAYRLFDTNNILSLANIIRFETPRTYGEVQRKSKQVIATISNPIKSIADLHSSMSYLATGKINQAFAADATGDAYMRLNSIGVPSDELKGVNLIDNSNEIQNMLENGSQNEKKILGYFDKCSKANIPSKNVFIRLYKVRFSKGEAEVEQIRQNVENDNDGLPIYPSVEDKPSILGFSDKKELIACEIYLLPPDNHATLRDYDDQTQNNLFGMKINDLARKYRLYLYANSVVDLMVELSKTDKNETIYSNPAAAASQTGNSK